MKAEIKFKFIKFYNFQLFDDHLNVIKTRGASEQYWIHSPTIQLTRPS